MSLKYAILGFLNISPKTGYDLQKKNEQTLSHFWSSTQSQVYRTLKELEEAGLIESEITIQREKPNKRMYSLTGAGREDLIRWLSGPVDPAPHRNAFLVQLFFSDPVSPQTICGNLAHYREGLSAKLRYLQSEQADRRIDLGRSVKEKTLFRIIVDNGVRLLECEIAWADEAIRRLEQLPKDA
jgi:PadR family transcriptional regulator, regulatory protein AphA